MEISLNFVYLVALIPPSIIWLVLFFLRKDLRKEMIVMSFIIGILSVATSYYWWTVDWWRPETLFGTKVGIEDFIMGFSTGGIMTTIYEVLFKKKFSKRKSNKRSGFVILLLLANITSFLFWGIGITSFWASLLAMLIVSIVIIYFRRDLFIDAVWSAILMVVASLPFYYTAIFINLKWIDATFNMPAVSGMRITGIPIEDLIFWFFAGFLFGPFYE